MLQREYDSFVASRKDDSDGNSQGMTSLPTDYSSPLASVDAVMPRSIISTGPVSDLSEQSSSGLGEIPETPKGASTSYCGSVTQFVFFYYE